MVVQRIPRKVRFFDVSILSCSTARENSRAVQALFFVVEGGFTVSTAIGVLFRITQQEDGV